MKILWISHLVPFPPKAGVLIRSYNLVRELAGHHELDLLMLNQPRLMGDYYSSQAEGLAAATQELSRYVGQIRTLDIPAERGKWPRMWLALSSLFGRNGYTINWLRSDAVRAAVRGMTRDTHYDLVHFDTISLDIFRDCVASADTALALDHHNIESHMMNRRADKESHPLKRFYFRQEYHKLLSYEARNVPAYDGHIVCSEDDRVRLLQIAPDADVRVIPNGIRIHGDLPRREPVPGRLLFIGGLSWYPNAAAIRDFIVNIAPVLRERGVTFQFDIIGSNPPSDLVELSDRFPDITFHGFVDSIEPFYAQASAFVCPINDGGGTKLKVLDAMANRVPLIAYPLACEGIEVVDGQHARVVRDTGEFADAIEAAVRNPETAQTMADNGRRLVEAQYEYRSIGEALSAYFESLVEKRRR